LSPIRIIVQMLKPDCFLRYRISAGTRNFTLRKSDVYVLAAAATCGFTMVLFAEPVSHRNTFVRGTCTPPSALLVPHKMLTEKRCTDSRSATFLCLCSLVYSGWTHNVFYLSVYSSINYQNCEYDILKASELIAMHIGTCGPLCKGMKRSILGLGGQRSPVVSAYAAWHQIVPICTER